MAIGLYSYQVSVDRIVASAFQGDSPTLPIRKEANTVALIARAVLDKRHAHAILFARLLRVFLSSLAPTTPE